METRKIALITGVSRGLGRSMALHLAHAGVAVLGTYNRSVREAEELASQMAGSGQKLALLRLDVARGDAYPEFFSAVRQTLHDAFAATRIDYLVNNAGIGTFAPYQETTQQQFDELVGINLRAPYFLTQTLLPLINDGGRVLNVSTALTRGVVPGMSAYAATKGAVEVLTRYQATELADRGIRVNSLMGGAMETDFGGGMMRTEQVKDLSAQVIALGRIATPDDIASAVPAILSDAFRWATGGCIDVSGGQSL